MYSLMRRQLSALLEGCPLPLPALANCAALLWHSLADINWAGFYLARGDALVLGPFQGKPACTLIPFDRGVCGAAARTREIQLVPDVHAHSRAHRLRRRVPVGDCAAAGQGRTFAGRDGYRQPVAEPLSQEDAKGLSDLCELLTAEIDWTHGLIGEQHQ